MKAAAQSVWTLLWRAMLDVRLPAVHAAVCIYSLATSRMMCANNHSCH